MLMATITYGIAENTYKVPETISLEKNQIKVSVNPQVELISIVQEISNYPQIFNFLMSKDSSTYQQDVNAYFRHLDDHPVIKMFNRLSSQPGMLNFSAPSNIMLYADDNLRLREDVYYDSFVLNRCGGRDSLETFFDLLRDFAVQSSFNAFFKKNTKYYETIISDVLINLGNRNYINELESFYGIKQRSYNIILVSLYSFVGYGNSLLCQNGKRDLYNTLGPIKVQNEVPIFGDQNYLKYMIRHEFSHPFINPLTEKYWDYIKNDSSNFDSIPETAKKKVCGDWQECINEFVIRAITTYLAENESKELGLWVYEKEKSRGVAYLDTLLQKVKFYESNRNDFPNFELFYKNILDTFKEEKNENSP